MKLSEAIDRLEVGETVWVKATVDRINNEGKYIRAMPNTSSVYLDGHDEISLAEPTPLDALSQEYDVEPETIREWLDRGHAGSFEKVVVPDYVAEWYETHKDDLEYNIWRLIIKSSEEYEDYESNKTDMRYWIQYAPNHPIETLIHMKDGYTVKPNRWVVKDSDGEYVYDLHLCHIDTTAHSSNTTQFDILTFTNHTKAEAVAVLVEGSVEEV